MYEKFEGTSAVVYIKPNKLFSFILAIFVFNSGQKTDCWLNYVRTYMSEVPNPLNLVAYLNLSRTEITDLIYPNIFHLSSKFYVRVKHRQPHDRQMKDHSQNKQPCVRTKKSVYNRSIGCAITHQRMEELEHARSRSATHDHIHIQRLTFWEVWRAETRPPRRFELVHHSKCTKGLKQPCNLPLRRNAKLVSVKARESNHERGLNYTSSKSRCKRRRNTRSQSSYIVTSRSNTKASC